MPMYIRLRLRHARAAGVTCKACLTAALLVWLPASEPKLAPRRNRGLVSHGSRLALRAREKRESSEVLHELEARDESTALEFALDKGEIGAASILTT
jgi:hypothetical protein